MRYISFLLLFTGPALAAEKPPVVAKPAESVRTIVVDEHAIPVVRCALGAVTLLELSGGEVVMRGVIGNRGVWDASTGKDGQPASRIVALQVSEAGAQTDLLIVTDHGNSYPFILKEVSKTGEPYDIKVIVEPSGDLKARADKPVEWVPASEIAALKKQAETAQASAEESIRKAQATESTAVETVRANYPGTLRFGYSWDRKAGDKIGLEEIFTDGTRSFIRGHFQEPPALYEVKDGKPSLINFDFANGLYTVPKLLDRGYLAIGTAKHSPKIDFSRTEE